MLNKEYIPTPLVQKTERKPVEIVESKENKSHSIFRLFMVFMRFWLKTVFLRMMRRYDEHTSARELRELFEDLGGSWIKIGQLLSLRTDIFSAPLCDELAKLQYRAQGFPFNIVIDILKNDLNTDLNLIFESFEQQPVAAASLSQVHVAMLRDPHVKVAVKVLRPEAKKTFLRDMQRIKYFIKILSFFRIASHIGWSDAYRELDQMVREELDFRYEASNTQRMKKTLKNHKVYVPKVFMDYCSSSVLVTEFIDGVLMSEFIEIGTSKPERVVDWCYENRINPRKIGKRLFYTAMRQLFEDNLFHADLHPGNILLLCDSRFALIDFGTIGNSEKDFLNNYKASLKALGEKDYAKAADYTLRLTSNPPKLALVSSLRKELISSYRYWEGRSHLKGLAYHEKSLAAAG